MNTHQIQINGQTFEQKDIQEKLNDSNLHDWEKGIYTFILNWVDDTDYILQLTSGSTGTPKEIKLQKRAMIASAKRTIAFFNLKENTTAWLCLPINYIAGKMMVVRAIVGQLNLLISKPDGTPQIPTQVVEFSAMVPLQVQKLIDAKADFSKIEKLIIGGANVDNGLFQKIQLLPSNIYATYGMTETCSHIAIQQLNGNNPDKFFRLLDGVSISSNSENCLEISTPELLNGKLITNDIVEIYSNSTFKVIGRIDNVINSGGIKLSPEKLENEISAIIKKECIIVPEKDEILGHRIVLIVEGTTNILNDQEMMLKIKLAVGKHSVPKVVYFVTKFPRTESMKINRQLVIKQLKINQ